VANTSGGLGVLVTVGVRVGTRVLVGVEKSVPPGGCGVLEGAVDGASVFCTGFVTDAGDICGCSAVRTALDM